MRVTKGTVPALKKRAARGSAEPMALGRYRVVALLALLFFHADARAHASPSAIDLRRGDVHLQYDTATGLSLTYRDVPVILRSTVNLVTPGWKQVLYDGHGVTPSMRQW